MVNRVVLRGQSLSRVMKYSVRIRFETWEALRIFIKFRWAHVGEGWVKLGQSTEPNFREREREGGERRGRGGSWVETCFHLVKTALPFTASPHFHYRQGLFPLTHLKNSKNSREISQKKSTSFKSLPTLSCHLVSIGRISYLIQYFYTLL